MKEKNKITIRSLIVGFVFAGIFAVITVYFDQRRNLVITGCQIPVAPYFLLFVTVLLLNPLCALLRFIRRFSVAEILTVFIMGLVSSGVSTFGLAAQLMPVMGSFFNQHWNNEQSQWNTHITPYVKEGYFLAVPGIQEASLQYRKAVDELEHIEQSEPQNISEQEQIVAQKRTALAELEQQAFKRVDTFRRGLPEGMRAFPGFIPRPEEGIHIYLARVSRFSHGLTAAGDLRGALELIDQNSGPGGFTPDATELITAKISSAIKSLSGVSDPSATITRKDALSTERQELNNKVLQIDREIKELAQQRDVVAPDELKSLDRKINRLGRKAVRVDRDKQEVAESIRRTELELQATGAVAEVITQLTELKDQLQQDNLEGDLLGGEVTKLLAKFPSFDASLRSFVIGDIPWSYWLGPLARWALVIALTYLVLMTFNLLIFRQWAHNERLIYPLAQLPELLVGADTDTQYPSWPPIFRSGLFWIGVLIPAGILGWNMFVTSAVVPGLAPIDINNRWDPYVTNTAFEGLAAHTKCNIFFAMIGLTFLIPTEISFSLWFFSVGYLAQLLILVWLGYGVNVFSFPAEFIYTFNFRTAEGAGALVVFALVVLYKCRKYIFCAFSPGAVKDLQVPERRELKISSILFILGSIGLILVLWRGMGANLAYCIFFYFVIMVITIGLVRAVAEGGVLGFQAWSGPFHFIRTLFGMNKVWTSATLFAPLTVYYAVLFFDIKTFIAPAMANCIKIRDDLKMERLRFHVAIVIALAIAGVAAIGAHLIMAYDKGGDTMSSWFYTGFPRHLFRQITEMTKTMPVDETANHLWIAVGALLMTLLLWGRRFLFWLPHPIGLIMLVNPVMNAYWFSILIGWISKKLVTKYGNKGTYETVRAFFIGLIVGQIMMVVLGMIIAQITGIDQIVVTLNENAS